MLVEDKILFNEIKNRNLKVYEALFTNYYPQLVRFAEGYIFDKQECEDIVQNLFIYFWENAEKVNLDLSIKSYFYQSVKNRCLNHLRDLQIHDKHNLLYLEAMLNQENYEELQDPEIIIQINAAIAKLPEQMAEIIKLKYLEGKKLMEIARMNQISENTVKTQLQRAKDKLRKILAESSSLKFIL
jgi:RNA polymerase sigma-70 factor (ECF subfamily)